MKNLNKPKLIFKIFINQPIFRSLWENKFFKPGLEIIGKIAKRGKHFFGKIQYTIKSSFEVHGMLLSLYNQLKSKILKKQFFKKQILRTHYTMLPATRMLIWHNRRRS